MRIRGSVTGLLIVVVLISGSWVSASPLEDFGWTTYSDDPDIVIINVTASSASSITLEIEREYTADYYTGDDEFRCFHIYFEKIDPNAVNTLIIDREQVTNNTGRAWNDFSLALGPMMVGFNQGNSTLTSEPLPKTTFYSTSSGSAYPDEVYFNGGLVRDGEVLTIGGSSDPNDQMVIQYDGRDGSFVLIELPKVPEPVTLSLLACGLALMGRRRSR